MPDLTLRHGAVALMLLFSPLLCLAQGTSSMLPSLTIEQAVQEALAANLEVAARRHDIDLARAELISARLRPNPELGLEMENLDRGITYSDETEYVAALEFTLEAPGVRRGRITLAQQGLTLAEQEFEAVLLELLLDVRAAALDVMLTGEQRELASNTLEQAEAMLALNEARHAAGDIDGIELRRSRLHAQQTANALRRAERDHDATLRDLNLLLGQSQPRYRIRDEFRPLDELPDVEAATERALRDRADLRAARTAQQMADSDLRLQQVSRRPEIALGTELRRFRGNGNYLGFSVSLPLPLFDRNQGEISRARTEQLQAELGLRALQAEVENQVLAAYSRLQQNRDQLTEVQAELEEAQALRDITEQAYGSGEVSLLEVLDAIAAHNDALATYLETRAQLALDLYLFDYLTATAQTP